MTTFVQNTFTHLAIRGRRTQGREEHGFAIVAVLSLAIPLIIISGSVLGFVMSNHAEVERRAVVELAQSVATSGVHEVLARLDENPNLTGNLEIPVGGNIAIATLVDWDGDGVDNDDDGRVDDEDEERMLSVRVEGWVNGTEGAAGNLVSRGSQSASSAIEVLLMRNEVDFLIEQSVYLDDPASNIDISGASFVISGRDHTVDGVEIAGAQERPGIGVAGDPAAALGSIAHNQVANIVGAGGTPSVVEVTPVDLEQTIRQLVPVASTRWLDDASFSGSLGTPDAPIVAHARENLYIHGKSAGHGILLVEGDLVVKGNFEWTGIILCGGSVRFAGGGQDKDMIGGFLCLGDLSAWIWGGGDDAVEEDTFIEDGEIVTAEINGGVEIRYSTDAIDQVSTLVSAGFTLVSWVER